MHQSTPDKPTLLFLHGFLGSGLDFDPVINSLQEDYQCIAPDLPNDLPAYPNLFGEVALKILPFFKKHSPVCAIGYSLGGRILMEMAKQGEIQTPLILLSSHTGLQSTKEKRDRHRQDLNWAKKLEELSFEKFLLKWYDQPLFEKLRLQKEIFLPMLDRRTKQKISPSFLMGLSLAHQSPFDPWKYSRPSLFVYGQKDSKYQKLYSTLPLVEEIPEASHALHLEKTIYVSNIIKTFMRIYGLARSNQISRH